jgi:hypothetical protein
LEFPDVGLSQILAKDVLIGAEGTRGASSLESLKAYLSFGAADDFSQRLIGE